MNHTEYYTLPAFDTVALSIGSFHLKWYAIAYMAGVLVACWYSIQLAKLEPRRLQSHHFVNLVGWCAVGIVIGGRLGEVLFWNTAPYLAHPLEIVAVWKGGMAFHGGLVGTIVAIFLYTRRHKLSFLVLADHIACAAPIGLFLGRVANFINGELYGRITDVPWAVIFPTVDPNPRHPSQLYEAGFEGILLFIVMFLLSRRQALRASPGFLSGAFLIGYGIARCVSEFFREPELDLGAHAFVTWGQILCIPMILVGFYLALRETAADDTEKHLERILRKHRV